MTEARTGKLSITQMVEIPRGPVIKQEADDKHMPGEFDVKRYLPGEELLKFQRSVMESIDLLGVQGSPVHRELDSPEVSPIASLHGDEDQRVDHIVYHFNHMTPGSQINRLPSGKINWLIAVRPDEDPDQELFESMVVRKIDPTGDVMEFGFDTSHSETVFEPGKGVERTFFSSALVTHPRSIIESSEDPGTVISGIARTSITSTLRRNVTEVYADIKPETAPPPAQHSNNGFQARIFQW